MSYQAVLDEIQLNINQYYGIGEVATYIPELAKVDPRQFAMTVTTLDGKTYSVGSSGQKFSIQSISKVIVLTMALESLGGDLWDRIGKEPSGNSFNSLIQLEQEKGIPRNPFINAGALVTTDEVIQNAENAYDAIIDFVRKVSLSDKIEYDYKVANSELETADRNRALAFFMKSFGNIKSSVTELIDVYCHHCSLSMTTEELSRLFLFLANKGINPLNGKIIASEYQAKRVNALMLTCGLYDNVGSFAYQVGIPAKSGVGGGIVGVIPGKLSLCVWSPELNSSGNSLVGTKALELFSELTGLSIF